MFIILLLPVIFQIIHMAPIDSDPQKMMVLIKPYSAVKFFNVPVTDKPVISWMDIQKGIYPNTTQIQSMVRVGEPITIFVYFQDKSYLYDVKVTDCWAYDNEKFEESKNKLHLMEDHPKKKTKLIDKWTKIEFAQDHPWKTLLYASLSSFKFPDTQHIFITCDIELCFKNCNKLERISHHNSLEFT